jgi:hypothetical protein
VDLGILDDKVYPVDGLARNTRSQTQVCTITQEVVIACIHNYGAATNRYVTACCAALRQYPSNMPHAVLDKNHGPPHGNVAPPSEPQVQGTVGQILHEELGHLA